ncbi:40S ribosomal protein S7 [Forsythia ovata]|uniref:40S ribosomal protein S7 n=2 Tax=Forsythia ovata TaxID=205694 RepID=A0ABD1WTW6_9LAMI
MILREDPHSPYGNSIQRCYVCLRFDPLFKMMDKLSKGRLIILLLFGFQNHHLCHWSFVPSWARVYKCSLIKTISVMCKHLTHLCLIISRFCSVLNCKPSFDFSRDLEWIFTEVSWLSNGGFLQWLSEGQIISFKMFTALQKIHKDKDAEPTEFEETVAQALFDLENTNQEIKSDLKDLYINSAMQIDVSGNKKAVVIHVPYRLRKAFRKIHPRLVRELEKKFSGKEVVLIATRRILRPPKKGSAAQRPRTRTLTAVHEAVLEDVVYPAEIVGKRVRYRLDGSKIMKVFLDPKAKNDTENKLETFAGVYRKLSGKDVVFEFPITEA